MLNAMRLMIWKRKAESGRVERSQNDAARGAGDRATGEQIDDRCQTRAQKPRKGWTSSRLATISAADGLPCIALAIAIFVAL